MHDYSIDRHPKEKIIFLLAYAAITLAPFANEAIHWALARVATVSPLVSSSVSAIPVLAMFTAIYFAFDKWLWRFGSLRSLLLVPDLNGRWTCSGTTNLSSGSTVQSEWSGIVTIVQSWSRIQIHLKTANSASKSIAASVFHEPGIGYRLLYQYANVPHGDRLDLQKHSGFAELLFAESCNDAEGYYFTDRSRQTTGVMKIERVS